MLNKIFFYATIGLSLIINSCTTLADMDQPFDDRLSPKIVKQLFPESTRHTVSEGDPPISTVYFDQKRLGYLFSTHETVRPAGYSGSSFDIVVALRDDGVIAGHQLLEENEPLISDGMIGPKKFEFFLNGLNGHSITNLLMRGPLHPLNESSSEDNRKRLDAVSGATISALSMYQAIINSASKVGYITKTIKENAQPLTVDKFSYEKKSWPDLVADGSIKVLTISYADLRSRMGPTFGIKEGSINTRPKNKDTFIKLYVGLATIPSIGRNLFGPRAYRRFSDDAQAGEQQLFIGSEGGYSWIPSNPSLVPVFDLIQIRQGTNTYPIFPENFYRARRLAITGYPLFHNAGRVRVTSNMGLDPLKDWSIELLISQDTTPPLGVQSTSFELKYRLPQHHVLGSDWELEKAGFKDPNYLFFGLFHESQMNAWQIRWVEEQRSIIGVLGLLTIVTLILFFQNILVQYRKTYRLIRITVLCMTLIWLGWISGTQLSILNIINYLTILVDGLDWETVLYEPLMVILVIYVLATLLLWGRGVFCGWLCPFGALQEILNKIARVVGTPQLRLNHTVQERLWSIKYIAAIVLLGLAFYSSELSSYASEIEPFKTAITLKFNRSWPYLLYAAVLLAIGLFSERFFCRFLCPLGGLLSLSGRLHVLNWLKRHDKCGNPCQICSASCPVGAINDSGSINLNECFQCLDCQLEYVDNQRCPALVSKR